MAPKAATVPSLQPMCSYKGWFPEAGVAGHSPPTALFPWWWWDVEPNPELPVKLKSVIWHVLRIFSTLESIRFCFYPRGLFNRWLLPP